MWGKRNCLSFETAVGGIEPPSPQLTVQDTHREQYRTEESGYRWLGPTEINFTGSHMDLTLSNANIFTNVEGM